MVHRVCSFSWIAHCTPCNESRPVSLSVVFALLGNSSAAPKSSVPRSIQHARANSVLKTTLNIPHGVAQTATLQTYMSRRPALGVAIGSRSYDNKECPACFTLSMLGKPQFAHPSVVPTAFDPHEFATQSTDARYVPIGFDSDRCSALWPVRSTIYVRSGCPSDPQSSLFSMPRRKWREKGRA